MIGKVERMMGRKSRERKAEKQSRKIKKQKQEEGRQEYEAGKRQQNREQAEQNIEQQLALLQTELLLRLYCDAEELCLPETMLWVDSLMITDITWPSPKGQAFKKKNKLFKFINRLQVSVRNIFRSIKKPLTSGAKHKIR